MTRGEQQRWAASEGVGAVDNPETPSRLVILRERRLRRQEEGRDPDYVRARRRRERQAIQEAVLYASSDTSTINCRDGSYRDRTRAVSKQNSMKRP
jgi:hypothetical protein